MPTPTNDSPNIKLEDAQNQALEEAKGRLMNIESEISIATKNLKVLKGEIEKSIKDNKYQTELLNRVTSQVEETNTRLNVLTTSVLTGSTALSEINQEIGKKGDILKAMEVQFKKREDVISTKEQELVTRETSVGMREEDVKKSELVLKDKHAKIKDFVETI